MKKTVAVVVAIVFVLAFAAPVFAQDMTHNAVYEMDGTIDMEKQVGHLCNTGAEMKQTIEGEGAMTKVMDTAQVKGVLTVSDDNDWVTAEDAVRNLTVTSVIELCAPPKTERDVTLFSYGEEGWGSYKAQDGEVIDPRVMYHFYDWADGWVYDGNYYSSEAAMLADFLDMSVAEMRASLSADEIEEELENLASEVYVHVEPTGLTDQIWAAQVEADAGFSGRLTQDFEAAYGGYEDWPTDGPVYGYGEDEEDHEIHSDTFGFRRDEDNYWVTVTGDDYVGNYFNIDQFARTSQGTTKRYIDISSPWSHAYLYEDMEVVGMSEIEESFVMDNLEPGAEAVPDWWDLF